ncbi:MAG: PHP domain-containing protein [Candidatus Methylomirabilales bacterium]
MSTRYHTGADLHLHSSYSDGSFSPQEVISHASALGLNPIALTDHDTVAGIPEALRAGNEMEVEVIPGVEISVHEAKQEIHILGYFVQWEDPAFQRTLNLLEAQRRERLDEMVRRLDRLGVPVSLSEVLRIAGKGTVGRLHVARTLLAQGAVSSLHEAFDRFLAQSRPAYVERREFTARQAISAIRDARGVAVLAHPGTDGLTRLPSLIEAGLQGIEVFHPSHTSEEVFTLSRVATEHDLLVTGGSDCHGRAKGQLQLGQVRLSLEYVERLRQATPA